MGRKRKPRLLIGTSGWAYSSWRGKFYPEDLPTSQFLTFYADHFRTTEVNSSFYRLPRESTYSKWYEQTPSDFIFAVKASQLITHVKRLRDVKESWREFVIRAKTLKEKLGPILLQFPPRFGTTDEDVKALEQFLCDSEEPDLRVSMAMEFRHVSGFADRVLDLLKKTGVALVIAHSSRYPLAPMLATAPFVYFRFHGPKELFASAYSETELRAWASSIAEFMAKGHDVYAYFNNDARGDAVPNARRLLELLEGSLA